MSAPILQFKRGNYDNLDFGLRSGEPALTLDTFDLFVGINSVFADNKFFGSHRYWQREDGDTALRLRLVDKTGNVANSIHLKSPDAHTGITTYTLPSEPIAGEFLKVDAEGTLVWASDFGEINVEELFANDATFGGNVAFTTTTASTDPSTGGVVITGGLGVGGDVNIGDDLGVTGIGTFGGAVTIYDDTQSDDKDTGSLVLEGGLGVEKNVNIGGDLNVTGISTFVGSVTFQGGTINLGDENTDNINVAGEFISNLTPNDDNTYDIGIGTQRWRNAAFSGVGTFATSVRTPLLNSSNTTLQAPTIGNYVGERVRLYDFDDPLNTNYAIGVEANHIWFGVDNYGDNQGFKWYGEETQVMRLGGTGNLTIEGDLRINGNDIKSSTGDTAITLSGNDVSLADHLSVAGVSTFTGAIDANGDLDVDGHTELDDVNVSGIATISNLDVQTGFDVYANSSVFHQNVVIQGNLTVNGEEVILSVGEKIVEDKHIVLGFTTTGNADDITANGGGIAIASTEGHPLVNLQVTGINTEPNTYKQLIWTSAGTFGVGTTDAFLFNYAVGIGSTQVPEGVYLAVGEVQITDNTIYAENIEITGISTFSNVNIDGGTIDGTVIGGSSPAAASFTELDYDNSTTIGISTVGSLYVGINTVLSVEGSDLTLSNIDAIDAVTKATLEATLALDPNDFDSLNVSGIGTIGGLLDLNGGLDVTGQTTLNNDLGVTGVSTFTGLIDSNGGLDVTGQTTLNNDLQVIGVSTFTTVNATTVNVSGTTTTNNLTVSSTSTFSDLISANGGVQGDLTGNVTGNINSTGVSTFSGTLNSTSLINATNISATGISTFNTLEVTENTTLGNGSGDELTVNATSTFNAPATFLSTLTGTISTATRATQVDTTETGTAAEFYPTFVSNSASTQSQTVRTDAGISYNPDSNTLTVPNIKTENLKHSSGTQAIAIDSSGNVGLSSNLTVAGNLFVNGSTTSVNTTTLKVKDSLVDLGKIDDPLNPGTLIAPTSDLNIDVGILLNYFADAASRKAAVYWDDDVSRIAIASRVTEAASVLTAQAYAALEVGGLWVNNACTGGAAEVISCFGGNELEVRNVLIDAGTF